MQGVLYSDSETLSQQRNPDFYLASTEGYGLDVTRACWTLKTYRSASGKDLILVEVCPGVIYRDRNGKSTELDKVILAARHLGYSVGSIREWPFYVHVAKLTHTSVPSGEVLSHEDVETIAWGELYPTEAAAMNSFPK